jgi:hypothetical protein
MGWLQSISHPCTRQAVVTVVGVMVIPEKQSFYIRFSDQEFLLASRIDLNYICAVTLAKLQGD